MGFTMAEKILARAASRSEALAGEYLIAKPDYIMAHEATIGAYEKMREAEVDSFFDRNRIVVVFDHLSLPVNEREASIHKAGRELMKKFGIGSFF